MPCQNFHIENMGFEHLPIEYLIAFYREVRVLPSIGKSDVLASHYSSNYLAVLEYATKNQDGICVNNGYSII